MARQHRGEETRLHILSVAERSFAQQGYNATGISEICDRAGVSKGAFYHHFDSKQALFLELLEGWLGRLDAQLEEVRVGASDVPQALLRMADMVRPIIAQAQGQLPILFEFWIQAGRDPAIWKATIEPYRRYRDLFAEMIQAGIDEGTLQSTDPDLAAQVLLSLAVGLLLLGLLDPDGADWGQVLLESMSMFLGELKRSA